MMESVVLTSGDAWRSDCSSAPMAVRTAVMAATNWMAQRDTPRNLRDNAELVLAEVCNNIVEHAYDGNALGRIRIRLHAVAAGIICKIEDSGIAMAAGCPPISCQPDTPAELPDGGYGWMLIQALASDIRYRRRRGHNILKFTIPGTAAETA